MNNEDFRDWSHRISDWAADYRANLSALPVRAQVQPGFTYNAVPEHPPARPENMEQIFADFEKHVLPGISHWQHPRHFAYFSSNAPPPSVLAEQIVNAMAPLAMLWQTSPAATELETRMMEWLGQAMGLPKTFTGVIYEAASSSTFAAILTMREKALAWAGNQQGLFGQKTLRIYGSGDLHSSVEKAIWMSGIGADNFIRLPVSGPLRSLDCEALEQAIIADKAKGFLPAGIVCCVGGTSVGATDNLVEVCAIAKRHNLYVHVDAAWAGSAMIAPEFRHYWKGIDEVDSLVFNPHKWLGAQQDCSAFFVKSPADLVHTLAIQPEYLKTQGADGVINYSEWSVVLGRRFRALKLWFLLRSYGVEGLADVLRNHVKWSHKLCEMLRKNKDFEITTEPMLSLFSFRHVSKKIADLNAHNLSLVKALNDDGRIYLTQSKLDDKMIIRFHCGSFYMQESDIDVAYLAITEVAEKMVS